MINNYLQFISNNVKGLQSLEKRVKVFEYLKNCISNNGFVSSRDALHHIS